MPKFSSAPKHGDEAGIGPDRRPVGRRKRNPASMKDSHFAPQGPDNKVRTMKRLAHGLRRRELPQPKIHVIPEGARGLAG